MSGYANNACLLVGDVDSAVVAEVAEALGGGGAEILRRRLLERASRARQNPAEFFAFVMREEFTHARIRVMPHQKVLFDFAMAHERCVIRMPVGSSKTFCMSSLTLWLIGQNPTARGAIISSSQAQASKPFSMVRDYIENKENRFPELRMVFPKVRPSRDPETPWTQTKLVVDRPPGIRDYTLTAIGATGALPGSRLSWILVDDVLTEENTRTEEQREWLKRRFNRTVVSRRDAVDSRIVVCNTPYHPRDLTYALSNSPMKGGAGWPALTMDIEGGVIIENTDWDTPDVRPSYVVRGDVCRLSSHDSDVYMAPEVVTKPDGNRVIASGYDGPSKNPEHFDFDETVPLWPEKFSRAVIDDIRETYKSAMAEFWNIYMCRVRDDASAACKEEWITRCKRNACAAGFYTLEKSYRGPNLTVTGIDLGVGLSETSGTTAWFTFEVIPEIEIAGTKYRNARRILDVEIGRYAGRQIVDTTIDKIRRFNSYARVETNAAQKFIKDWVVDVDIAMPIRAHTTGKNKHHRAHGVAGIFIELENGAWLIPCDPDGIVPEPVLEWIKQCLFFQPDQHTGDALIGSWLAREEARFISGVGKEGEAPPRPANEGMLGASLLMR